jgi:ABC-type uncharacterized transport system fused permease/ATPase subunit
LIAGIQRLVELTDGTEKVLSSGENKNIEVVTDNYIVLENLTLQHPNHQTNLIQDLSITINPGKSLLIVGASGVGKTTLLRAIAGLWLYGNGKIVRPENNQVLFLPQRPYMALGTLRQQLLYPHGEIATTQETLLKTLRQVDLPDLAARYGGIDAMIDWGRVLSLGEQQRLAFGRLLLNRPRYAILDEATSALDEETSAYLYEILQASSVTYISVAHRNGLVDYHQFVLELQKDNWQLLSVEDY